MNKIIMIGKFGDFYCYLNVDKETAIEKYFKKYPTDDIKYKNFLISTIREICFDECFGVFGNLKNY